MIRTRTLPWKYMTIVRNCLMAAQKLTDIIMNNAWRENIDWYGKQYQLIVQGVRRQAFMFRFDLTDRWNAFRHPAWFLSAHMTAGANGQKKTHLNYSIRFEDTYWNRKLFIILIYLVSWLRQDAKAMLHAASNIHEMMLWLFLQCSANFNRVAASCTVPDSSMVPFHTWVKGFLKLYLNRQLPWHIFEINSSNQRWQVGLL